MRVRYTVDPLKGRWAAAIISSKVKCKHRRQHRFGHRQEGQGVVHTATVQIKSSRDPMYVLVPLSATWLLTLPIIQTQVITIPFTPDGKYRPDLLVSAPPALMPPPQGIRRIASEGNTIHRMQSSRSQTDLPSLPRGAGQPIPNVMEADMRIADDDQSGHRHSQGSHHSHRAAAAAGLQPLRPQPGTPLPPDYQSEGPRSFLAM